MVKKITFSNKHSTIEDIEAFYFHSEKSSSLHFIETNNFLLVTLNLSWKMNLESIRILLIGCVH